MESAGYPIPAGEEQGHGVEAEAMNLAEGRVEEAFGSVIEGYEEERRLGGEVG